MTIHLYTLPPDWQDRGRTVRFRTLQAAGFVRRRLTACLREVSPIGPRGSYCGGQWRTAPRPGVRRPGGRPMLCNYMVTAVRNLMRNRLYAGITILGLAVAFPAAILIGQFVRNELSYDHWIPGYQRVYKIANTLVQPGQPPSTADIGPAILARQIRAALPGVEAVARLDEE